MLRLSVVECKLPHAQNLLRLPETLHNRNGPATLFSLEATEGLYWTLLAG